MRIHFSKLPRSRYLVLLSESFVAPLHSFLSYPQWWTRIASATWFLTNFMLWIHQLWVFLRGFSLRDKIQTDLHIWLRRESTDFVFFFFSQTFFSIAFSVPIFNWKNHTPNYFFSYSDGNKTVPCPLCRIRVCTLSGNKYYTVSSIPLGRNFHAPLLYGYRATLTSRTIGTNNQINFDEVLRALLLLFSPGPCCRRNEPGRTLLFDSFWVS